MKAKYKVIATIDLSKIRRLRRRITDAEVVLTHERRLHIRRSHPSDYFRITHGLRKTLENPSEIYQSATSSNTLYYIRRAVSANQNVVVRLNTNRDNLHPKNSVITSWIINDVNLNKLAKKNKIIYTKDSEK